MKTESKCLASVRYQISYGSNICICLNVAKFFAYFCLYFSKVIWLATLSTIFSPIISFVLLFAIVLRFVLLFMIGIVGRNRNLGVF